MVKFMTPICFFLLLTACGSRAQAPDRAASDRVVAEGMKIYSGTLTLSPGSAQLPDRYRRAAAAFEEAYRVDSTNRAAWMWLPDCYYQLAEFDQAMRWSYRELRAPALSPELQAAAHEPIGFCQLQLENLEPAGRTLRHALRLYTSARDQQSRRFLLVRLAEEVYGGKSARRATTFGKAGIDPCRYGVGVLRLFLDLHQEEEGFVMPPHRALLE